MSVKYCRWYADRWEGPNKWLFVSNCGQSVVLSRGSKNYKAIYDGKDCPYCGVKSTVGELM